MAFKARTESIQHHHLEPSIKALHAALSDAKKVLLGTSLVQAEKRKTLGCNLR